MLFKYFLRAVFAWNQQDFQLAALFTA
jgi:hypothetical protein